MAIATCLSCLGATERADAFGFFEGRNGTATVRSHRIAVAISPERTVLWDELAYTGAPADFLWLLPVRGDTTFDVANPAWFDALDAVTRPRVEPLSTACAPVDSGGCSCLSTAPEAGYPPIDGYASPWVQVLRTNTVGPYRTNLIRSSEPGALASYIAAGGYVVPPGFEATLAAYIADGYDFLAASVRPTAGVSDMKPIRVVTKGEHPVLPFRMLAAGAAPAVDVELYVFAEGRQALPELTEVRVDARSVTWDARLRTSNYDALASAALAANDSLSFLTPFASPDPFAMWHLDVEKASLGFQVSGGSVVYTLSDLYFAQGRIETSAAAPPCPSIVAALRSDLQVSDSEPLEPERLDDALFACGQMLDLQQALIGMHPARLWLTRLDLELRPEVLAQDPVLAAHPSSAPVLAARKPAHLTNAPASCQEPIFRSSVAPRRVRPFGWASVPFLVVAAALRRRFRRTRGVS